MAEIIRQLNTALETAGGESVTAPSGLLTVAYNAAYDAEVIAGGLAAAFPSLSVHGGSSCMGAMTERGVAGGAGEGLAALLMLDEAGDYGAALVPLDGDPQSAAQRALAQALREAGRPGELPEVVWCSPSPGHEEAVLAGLRNILGDGTPIIGGSVADDEVQGRWSHFAGETVEQGGVGVAVLFPSTEIGVAFRSGYQPTEHHGIVTEARGRTIISIDNEPAAAVYDRWTGGLLSDAGALGGGAVLGLTTMYPLGRAVGLIGGVEEYLLVHPERVVEGGGLAAFAEIAEGERVTLMEGTRDRLATRISRVADDAMQLSRLERDTVAGALVIYCAGCRLAIQDDMERVVAAVNHTLGGRPFLGAFTFGEQGCMSTGGNRHGNLMISVLVVGR